jgi:endonuclease/exonuclease/phosphatase family metal-dependent hydrolase
LGIFNIASGVGIDDKYDLGRTEETIRQVNPDVVALQEVRRESGDYPDNAAEIGAKLGMGQAWSPSERRWWRDDFGNGFLSRLPIEGGQLLRIPLPQTQERGHRNATLTRVKVGDATLTILGTHVDRQVDQPAQLAFLRDLFLATPEPAVLMGDMNVTIGNPVVQELIREHGAVEVGPVNDRRIELILVRGAVRRVGAGQLDLHASDHALVWADVEVTGK